VNVRFSDNKIRFRVTPTEFDKLDGGDHLQLETIPLTFVVQVAAKPPGRGMAIDLTCSGVHLVLSREELEEFKGRPQSRKGIQASLTMGNGKPLEVAFEVDVKPRE